MAPPASPRFRRNGFSLVELMVGLFIVALVAGVALLALPDGAADLRRDADAFALRVGAARDEAITAATPVSVTVGPAGYYFEKRQEGAWQPLSARGFETREWSDGVAFAGQADANTRVVFDSLGLASSDERIVLSGAQRSIAVRIGRDGGVAVEPR